MPTLDPAAALVVAERALREIIRDHVGDRWRTTPEVSVEAAERAMAAESDRRGVVSVDPDLLNFTLLLDLGRIFDAHFSLIGKAAGGSRAELKALLSLFNRLRNLPAHSRDLVPFERDLLSGITGYLANLAAIARSTKGQDMLFYPVIDSVIDSFGHIADPPKITHSSTRLVVGQTVIFACRATDPAGRTLTWELADGHLGETLFTAEGASVELVWMVRLKDVRERALVCISVCSSGTYHRDGETDGSVFFDYNVDPPEPAVGLS